MLRRNYPVLHHVDRSFWEYVEKNDHGRMRCKFCGHAFAKDTAITRIKFHLAGVKRRGTRICGKVPQDVQDAALAAIDGPPKKKLIVGAGPTNNEVTIAISASAQEQNNVDMAQQREPLFTGEFEWANDLLREEIELRHDTPATSPITEQANPETDFARVQVLEQSNAERDNLSVDYVRTQGMEQGGEERRVCSDSDMENTGDRSAQHVDRNVPRTIDELKKRSKYKDMVDFLKSGWTLLMTNLILEIASAVFDQLGYALVGMVFAFVALLLSTVELIHMARKERMPSSLRPSASTLESGKPVGTIVEYLGLIGAVWQCIYSTVEYVYARQKKDNPIKMCLLPFIFLSCVVISKLIKNRVH